jgi:hypothetical protein
MRFLLSTFCVCTAALAALAIALVACNSSSNDVLQASLDAAARVACEEAGNYCGQVEPGCGTGTQIGSCGGDIPCCSAGIFCGQRTCSTGNTCDTSVQEYCSGTQTTPNCGSVACLGDCTCGATGNECQCPPCQRTDAGSCSGTGSGVVYFCDPSSGVGGSAVFPADAGTCASEFADGYVCCTQ